MLKSSLIPASLFSPPFWQLYTPNTTGTIGPGKRRINTDNEGSDATNTSSPTAAPTAVPTTAAAAAASHASSTMWS